MLRAVGMRRSHLVRAFVIEGTLYAFAAERLGAAARDRSGLGDRASWPHRSSGGSTSSLSTCRFAIEPDESRHRLLRRRADLAGDDRPDQPADQPDQHHQRHPRSSRAERPTKRELARSLSELSGSCSGLAAWFVASIGNRRAGPLLIVGPPAGGVRDLLPLASRLMKRGVSPSWVAAISRLFVGECSATRSSEERSSSPATSSPSSSKERC